MGAAAGAGLPVLAILATGAHFVAVFGLSPIARQLPRARGVPRQVRLVYADGRGALRAALTQVTRLGFTVAELTVERSGFAAEPAEGTHHERDEPPGAAERPSLVAVALQVVGDGEIGQLTAGIAEVDGVVSVTAGEGSDASE